MSPDKKKQAGYNTNLTLIQHFSYKKHSSNASCNVKKHPIGAFRLGKPQTKTFNPHSHTEFSHIHAFCQQIEIV